MPRNWNDLAENSDGTYIQNDFKHALYQLVTSQCIYARFRRQSVSYRLISTYRKEFAEATELMGLTLIFKDDQEYCFVRQDDIKLSPMDIQETRFLLTLRKAVLAITTYSVLAMGQMLIFPMFKLKKRLKNYYKVIFLKCIHT